MDKRQKVRDIMNDLRRGNIGWVKAQDEICALLDVVGRSEQLVICKKCGSSEMYQYTKTKDKCDDCGNIQDY